jgi:tetraacyldisaccharide 4'-kinase
MTHADPPNAAGDHTGPWALDKPTPARLAASWAYGVGRSVHRAFYDRGLLRRQRLGRPVICVGNLTVGGTGKTPFLMMMAGQLQRRGLRPAVLSRGYGAEPPAKKPRIVSDGQRFRAEVARSGDEPALIARRCSGVPVIIGASRFEAGCLAAREFDPDLFLLDDGFQHEALARDADLVLWDARDRPAAQRLLPAGRLREPLTGLQRATALILTHAEYLPAENAPKRYWRCRSATRALRRGFRAFMRPAG